MIDWSKQHCGVHQATAEKVIELMPDVKEVFDTFPDDLSKFTFDVKVHMLFPRQLPCMPGWHTDFVPRENGIQRFDQCMLDRPMYVWVSGPPLTEFKHGFLQAGKWHRFNQADEHRGCPSDNFTWRAFIRGIHTDILKPKNGDWLRRHTQVYILDNNYQW
jgi:hypothetical protein